MDGRTGRGGMWMITLIFGFAALLANGLRNQGINQAPVEIIQLALFWPVFIAVPIRRFHDMGRPWWWVLIFLGGMLVSFLFLMLDLTSTAGMLGLSAFSAITDTDTYMKALEALNETRPDDPIKPVEAMGLGGVSLGSIFFLVQFGWLHLVPGQGHANDYGPQPGAAATR
ncbi:DUF805 domain-containing protein [Parvularcula marina]|uniref:DUF805 domain-containing protein n=1 Tax=Parvularcula marina TaxID=2292771 RepID=A0A371RER5_9PROT|nr:DUF805 domain-containing protein [Parvularcula marina]RFB03949.1 DUF805 domain-containing protein [Parvularcula marina]